MDLRQRLMRYLKDQEVTVSQFVGLMDSADEDTEAQLRLFISHGREPAALIVAEINEMLAEDKQSGLPDVVEPVSPEDRQRIIQALYAFAESHVPPLGAPSLAKLISKANKGVPVSHRSVARFLSNNSIDEKTGEKKTHHSRHPFVRLCAKFAEGLPVPDPIGDMGRAMVALYKGSTSRLVGDFMTLPPNPSDERHQNSGFITSTEDDGFCRVVMKLEPVHAIFEGAAVLSVNHEIVSMADRLTGDPLHLILNNFKYHHFSGSAFSQHSSFDLKLERLGA